jgi:hypothetical protein
MERRLRLKIRPWLETVEGRALLSHIPPSVGSGAGPLASARGPQFAQAPVNGTIPLNQLLTPTGVPTAAESRREAYHASFVGQYTIGPGRFSTEAANFYMNGVGRSTVDLHSDMQLRVITPSNGANPPAGEMTIFTRNLDSNTQLGFDVVADAVDALGRPTRLTIYALDVNISSGIFVEGTGQGTITIHYGPTPRTPHFQPSSRRLPGVTSQGTASVVINAQVYGIGTSFNLRNTNINP